MKNRTKRYKLLLLLWNTGILLFLASQSLSVHAQEKEEYTLLEEMDFSDMDALLETEELTKQISFSELVRNLVSGKEVDKDWLKTSIENLMFEELRENRGYLVQMVLLILVFAILRIFSDVFDTSVSEIGFYMVYMVLFLLSVRAFLAVSEVVTVTMERLIQFMNLLVPGFCLGLMFTSGSITTIGFYQLTSVLLYMIQRILLFLVLPCIHSYLILELLNHMMGEELISKLTELLEVAVRWVLKGLLAFVVGINVIQGLLYPLMDTVKTSAITKTVSMLPGIGTSLRGIAEIVLSSGILIKNAVGISGILILILLCGAPLLKIGCLFFMYKLTAAIIQPIADKRLTGSITGVAKGIGLLGKLLITANAMLLITLALVTASTTWNR